MFARFKIDKNIITNNLPSVEKSILAKEISESRNELRKILLGNKGIVDGDALQKFCFPTTLGTQYNVFISHSHDDENEALALASWLNTNCGCRCFVDSVVWNNVYGILKDMDNMYCENEGSKPKTYNYNKRNYTTLHAYTMLSMSLLTMIQNAECFILIGNGESIDLNHIRDGKIISPWVYQELGFVNNIPHELPDRLKSCYKEASIQKRVMFSQGGLITENFVAQYSSNITDFRELSVEDILLSNSDWLAKTYLKHGLIVPKQFNL